MNYAPVKSRLLMEPIISPKSLSKSSLILIAMIAVAVFLSSHKTAAVNNKTWVGSGNWSNPANWNPAGVPGSNDLCIFDPLSTNNGATIDVDVVVAGIQINSSYAGTITQAPGIAVTFGSPGFSQSGGTFIAGSGPFTGNGPFNGPFTLSNGAFIGGSGLFTMNDNFTLSGGTFTGGSGNIDMNGMNFNAGSFTISGGTFTSTTGTLFIGNNFNHTAGTFIHNSGTVTFDSSGSGLVVPGSETFNNLTFNNAGNARGIADGVTLIAAGILSLNGGSLSSVTGTVVAQSAVTAGANFLGGGATLAITPNPNLPPTPRTITFAAGSSLLKVLLNDPDATITTSGMGTLNWQTFTFQLGTVQQGSVDFTFGGAYTQSGGAFTGGGGLFTMNDDFTLSSTGTFSGGGGNIDMNGRNFNAGSFTISGGTFTSTTGTLFIGNNFNHTAGTFIHNSGTVTFDSSGSGLVVPGSETFNDLNFNGNNRNIAANNTLIVTGTLALNFGAVNGTGTLSPQGNMVIASTFAGGSAAVTFSGSADQTFTNNGGVCPTGIWAVNKSAGAVTLTSNLTLGTSQGLDVSSGTLDLGPSFNLTAGAITIGANGILRNFGTGTLTAGGLLTINGTLHFLGSGDLTLGANLTNNAGGIVNLNGGGTGCGDPNASDQLQIRSTDATSRTWSGNGTFSLVDVDVDRQTAGTPPGTITAFGSSLLSNTVGWNNPGGCPVSVTSQPANQIGCPGGSASFSVTATGAGVSFQWHKGGTPLSNGGNISGADTSTLTINPVGAGDAGSYDATVISSLGITATSNSATLSINTPAAINTNPGDTTVCAGSFASFTATANGTSPLVQWQVSTDGGNNFNNLGGATSTTLSFQASPTENGNKYRAVFTNFCNSATTTPATLTVNTTPLVSADPADATVCEGATASFTAAANGSPSPTVQWQVSTDGGTNFNNIIGATATTLSFTAAASQNGNKYQAVFTNTCSTTTTNRATLTVNTAPTVTSNPVDTTVCEIATATFTAAANGSPLVQWQVSTDGGANFSNIGGATSTTLSFTASTSQNGNKFRAVFTTNPCNTTTTTPATLTVNTFPGITSDPGDSTVCENATATFTAAANGSPSPTVQWQVSTDSGVTFNNINGATATTLSFTAAASQNGNYYRAVFTTNPCPSFATNPAALTVLGRAVSSTSQAFPCSGGSGSVDVMANPICTWTAVSNDPFIHITNGASGNGNGTVNFTVDDNCTQPGRTGTITVAGSTLTIDQSNPTAVSLVFFRAESYGDGTSLKWQTGFETDNLGFNVYREDVGRRTLINSHLVAGSALRATATLRSGDSYVWWDRSTSKGAAYWLEDVDLKGVATWHGPFYPTQAIGKNLPVPLEQARTLDELASGQSSSAPVEFRAAPELMSSSTNDQRLIAASPNTLKLKVKREGWYRLTQSELVAAGFNTKFDPRLLQLFVDGRELPLLVPGEQDGSLDPADSIEFYGTGLDSPFTDARTYWLTAGSKPGLRISQEKNEGAPASSKSFTAIIERRDRALYFSALRNGEKENFFGAVIAFKPVDQQLTLSHLARTDSSDAQVEIALQGVTFTAHRVSVELNGAYIGQVSFDGQSQGTATLNASHSLLQEGVNIVRLRPLAGGSDVSLVDYVRISYQHSYSSDNDALKFTAASRERLTVDGFTSKSIRVFDVTDANSPQELLGEVSQQKTGYSVTFASSGEGQRAFLAFAGQPRSAPATLNQPSSLRSANARLLMISTRELTAGLLPLVALREKQGLSVAPIDIEDIYDEFSFGHKSPYAVKDFLAYANSNWKKKPRFVLFAGDASLDPKNYLGFGDLDLVPTRLVDTDYMETASDDWFSDLDNDGVANLATGRLPARTAEELSRMVAKIISYEQSSTADEALLVADANEGFDFERASAELQSLIPAKLRITQVNRGRLDPEMARRSLFEAIYRKQFLVNYAGHGSVNQWKANLLTNDDALALRNDHLPMFVMMTCLNGYFHDPALDSLGESLMKAEHGGAVAVWASSGMTMPTDQALLNQELYRLLFSRGPVLTIGEAVIRAKASVSDSDIRRTWILLGDPTMRMK